MGSHTDKVEYTDKANLLLVAFEDPQAYRWHLCGTQLEEIAHVLDRFAPACPFTSLFRTQVLASLLKEEGEAKNAATLAEMVQWQRATSPRPSMVVALQLGAYLLYARRIHSQLHAAGTIRSGVNAAAVTGNGLGQLAADAVGCAATLLQLVTNAMAVIAYVSAWEGAVAKEAFLEASLTVPIEADDEERKMALLKAAKENNIHLSSTDKKVLNFRGQLTDMKALCRQCSVLEPDIVLGSVPQSPPPRPAFYYDCQSAKSTVQLSPLTRSSDSIAFFAQLRCHAEADEDLTQLIHRKRATTSLVDSVPGLVDAICIGPRASFEVKLISRLKQLGATQVRSNDLFAHLLNATNVTDIDALPREYSLVEANPATQVAILGYSLRVPGASDPAQFWTLLSQGRDMSSTIPPSIFDLDMYHNNQYRVRNTMRTKHGNFQANAGHFDAEVFHLTEAQALQMDPQHRNALLAAFEALEMAGYSPHSSRGCHTNSTGVFIGGAGDDYRENCSSTIEPGFIAGNSRQALTANISHFFGFHGPSHTYDTACSSSLVAVEAACQSLINGRCDMALAGGVSVLTQPQVYIGLDRGYFLTKNGHGQCQTFDDGGDGYSRADGNSIVYLKLLKDALRDGDDIKGILEAIGTNHSGKSHSITHPHAPTQARLFQANCLSANIDPRHVKLVEMHGTGTQAGDANEMQSVLSFARGRSATDDDLLLGSVKANLGHSEAASGCVALVKVLLMLKHRQMVPHVGIKHKLNTKFPSLDHVQIPLHLQDLTEDSILACCNNFSAAGGNSSLFIRSPPAVSSSSSSSKQPRIIALSAASPAALKDYLSRLLHFLDDDINADLADVAFTLSAARSTQFTTRLALVVDSIASLKKQLFTSINATAIESATSSETTFALCFTGQGSQYLQMGKELYVGNLVFRDAIEKSRGILVAHGFPDFFHEVYEEKETCQAYHWQCAILAVELALFTLWSKVGITPQVVVGHSLGEYAALYAAGVVSWEDAVLLVARRAQLMSAKMEANTSAMLAVRLPHEELSQLISNQSFSSRLQVACINSPSDTVLAGPVADVKEAQKYLASLTSQQVRTALVDVPYAFHSRAVEPIVDDFHRAARSVKFRPPTISLLSNVYGRVIEAGEVGICWPDYLVRHMRETVLFAPAIQDLEIKCRNTSLRWIEVGPHPLCTSMLAATLATPSTAVLPSLRKRSNGLQTFLESIATLHQERVKINFAPLFAETLGKPRLLELPFYAWQYRNFWIPYTDRNLSTRLIEEKSRKVQLRDSSRKEEKSFTTTGFSLLTRCTMTASAAKHKAEYEIDLTQSPCREIVEGHLVHDVCLVPASMYSDIALQAGLHVLGSVGEEYDQERHALRVSNILMDEPVVLGLHEGIVIKTEGLPQDSKGMTIDFYFAGSRKHQGSCSMHLPPREQVEQRWNSIGEVLRRRIDSLKKATETRLTNDMIYQLFTKVVHYGPMYRAMQAIHLNATGTEAALDVTFQHAPCLQYEHRRSVVFPVYQDSMGQCTGFLPNLQADGDHVYVANGCQVIEYTAQMSEKAKEGDRVAVHCSMHEDKGQSTSDAYFFDAETGDVIGHMGGVRFRKIPLRVMKHLLPKPTKKQVAAAQSIGEDKVVAKAVEIDQQSRELDLERESALSPPNTEEITTSKASESELFKLLCRSIVEELAVDESELTAERVLADLGLDSLMSLTILGRLQEMADVELPASLFMDHPTLGAVQAYLSDKYSVDDSSASTPQETPSAQTSPDLSSPSPDRFSSPTFIPGKTTARSSMTSVDQSANQFEVQINTIRGGTIDDPPLLLIPEGSGSQQVYAPLVDTLSSRRLLVANFQSTGENWSLEELATSIGMVAKQELGNEPCIVGGWSLGGIIAYLLAREARLNIVALVLIDVPAPLNSSLEPLTDEIVGQMTALFPKHAANLAATIQAAHRWRCPEASKESWNLAVLYLRGNRAAMLGEIEPDSHWILREKRAQTATGWERFFSERLHVIDMGEANHFTILSHQENAEKVMGSIDTFLHMEVSPP